VNDFDELIGADVAGEERERLRGVHELLVEAGPPPELPASLQHVPRPGEVRRLRKLSVQRKIALVAAALIVLVVTFTAGFATGHTNTAQPLATLHLSGTKAAPHAQGTLDVSSPVSGNWPMTLSVSGLPKVAAPDYYYVWLVRKGKPLAPCGEFVVAKPSDSLTLTLSAPYKLQRGDTWIVTRKAYNQPGTGQAVLRPAVKL
jgi:hypothetical protein